MVQFMFLVQESMPTGYKAIEKSKLDTCLEWWLEWHYIAKKMSGYITCCVVRL